LRRLENGPHCLAVIGAVTAVGANMANVFNEVGNTSTDLGQRALARVRAPTGQLWIRENSLYAIETR
jgi:hypothetical protein